MKVDGRVATISIKKFPYRPTRDVSLFSGDASYFAFCSGVLWGVWLPTEMLLLLLLLLLLLIYLAFIYTFQIHEMIFMSTDAHFMTLDVHML
jgi:hypothetical protein